MIYCLIVSHNAPSFNHSPNFSRKVLFLLSVEISLSLMIFSFTFFVIDFHLTPHNLLRMVWSWLKTRIDLVMNASAFIIEWELRWLRCSDRSKPKHFWTPHFQEKRIVSSRLDRTRELSYISKLVTRAFSLVMQIDQNRRYFRVHLFEFVIIVTLLWTVFLLLCYPVLVLAIMISKNLVQKFSEHLASWCYSS